MGPGIRSGCGRGELGCAVSPPTPDELNSTLSACARTLTEMRSIASLAPFQMIVQPRDPNPRQLFFDSR